MDAPQTNQNQMSIFDDETPWTDGYGERGKRIKELEFENANLKAERDAAAQIIKQALAALPVGNVTTHTPESIPERINDIVKECASLSLENERLESERNALRIAFADASHSDCSIGAERFLKDGWLCANHKEELYKLRAAVNQDTERLDFLETNLAVVMLNGVFTLRTRDSQVSQAATLRGAIDARKKEWFPHVNYLWDSNEAHRVAAGEFGYAMLPFESVNSQPS